MNLLQNNSRYSRFYTDVEIEKMRRETSEQVCQNILSSFPNLAGCLMSHAEERSCLDSFCNFLLLFYRHISPPLPKEVFGTALVYLRHFFLHKSVMDFHPREILLTCLFLASKVCECHGLTLKKFIQAIPKNASYYQEFILNSELFLLHELNYELAVDTPFPALRGQLLELHDFIMTRHFAAASPTLLSVTHQELLDAVFFELGLALENQLCEFMRGDVCLKHPASVISLALLRNFFCSVDVIAFSNSNEPSFNEMDKFFETFWEKRKKLKQEKKQTHEREVEEVRGEEDEEENKEKQLLSVIRQSFVGLQFDTFLWEKFFASDESTTTGEAVEVAAASDQNNGATKLTALVVKLEEIRMSALRFDRSLRHFNEVEDRLNQCRNPLYTMGSEEYSKRQQERQKSFEAL